MILYSKDGTKFKPNQVTNYLSEATVANFQNNRKI